MSALLWLGLGLPLVVSSSVAAPLLPRQPLQGLPVRMPAPVDWPGSGLQLTVKLKDELRARAREDGSLKSETGRPLSGLQAAQARYGLHFRPALRLSAPALAGLEARARDRSGREQPDLGGIFVVTVERPGELLAAAEALQSQSQIEYVTLSRTLPPPPGDIAPTTDDYSLFQSYRGPDPGIDMAFAASLGTDGSHVQLSDCEYGWETSHEDLMDRAIYQEPGTIIPGIVHEYGYDAHGTAAIGEMSSVDNGYGCTGLVAGADVHTYPEYIELDGEEVWRRPDAIAAAIAASEPGDVVMLEMQDLLRPDGSFCPAEVDPTVWAVVRTGTDAGVIIVGAAGNGYEDLDGDWYVENYLSRGDSGAILVGAGSPDTLHAALAFSTFGSRVNLQGWGGSVFTLGYGAYITVGDDPDQRYTDSFSGTSSATAMVAAAAVALQDYVVDHTGLPLSPEQLRQILVDSGIPEGAGNPIGPLPDLRAAILSIDSDLDGSLSGYIDEDGVLTSTEVEPGVGEGSYEDGCGCSGTPAKGRGPARSLPALVALLLMGFSRARAGGGRTRRPPEHGARGRPPSAE